MSYGLLWNVRKNVNPFSHTPILQQTALNIFCRKIENLYNWMDNPWLKVINIVAKGEIACFEQFLLLSICFEKAVCCRSVRKCLSWGSDWQSPRPYRGLAIHVSYFSGKVPFNWCGIFISFTPKNILMFSNKEPKVI